MAINRRRSKLGLFRRACSHPATSRNKYRDYRAARDLERRKLGLRPEGVYRKDS